MVRKSSVLVPVIIAAVGIGLVGIYLAPNQPDQNNTKFPKGTVRIGNDTITVEIAHTDAEKQRWLTFRQEKIPQDAAMLIKYDSPDLYQIWMLNIQYNLDLVWFDKNGTVVYMIKDAPPCQNLVESFSCTYKTTKPSMFILASTAGFIDHHKIGLGTNMTIISA